MTQDIDAQAERMIAGVTESVVRRLGPVLQRGDRVAVEAPVDDADYAEPCVRVTLARGAVAYQVTMPGWEDCCAEIEAEMERQLAEIARAVAGRVH